MAITLVLTGAFAGQSVKLNNRDFIRGRLRLDGPMSGYENLVSYFSSAYNAFLEGSEELAKAQERDRLNATGSVESSGPGQSVGEAGAVGGSPEGVSSGSGPVDPAPSQDSVVGRAEGDASPTVPHDAATSFTDAKTAKLKAVLKSLDPSNDEHWTEAGLPAILAIEAAYGGTGITRKDVAAVLPNWNRQSAIAEVTNPTA